MNHRGHSASVSRSLSLAHCPVSSPKRESTQHEYLASGPRQKGAARRGPDAVALWAPGAVVSGIREGSWQRVSLRRFVRTARVHIGAPSMAAARNACRGGCLPQAAFPSRRARHAGGVRQFPAFLFFYARIREGKHSQEIAQFQAELAEARVQLQLLQKQLDEQLSKQPVGNQEVMVRGGWTHGAGLTGVLGDFTPSYLARNSDGFLNMVLKDKPDRVW